MKLRERHLEKLSQATYDALIIGGGINGATSAAALAGRGAKVALIDKGDFAGFTSQHSSNLIWGGIKYLETYDFRLVWELCQSRNKLMKYYPSTVKEIRFLATIPEHFRYPRLLPWLGAWLYWFMGKGFTQPPRLLSQQDIKKEESIIDGERSQGGFEYSDAYLYDNDARFVFNFIRSALNCGGIAANYVESLGAKSDANKIWRTQARDQISGKEFEIKSKVLINATGPFVDQHNHLTGQKTPHQHVFSKGVHLIVDQLTPHHRVLAFFASDGRLFFAIPMGARTCIGTTDTHVEAPTTTVATEDRQFILDNINRLLALKKPLQVEDIIAERCGVRPLVVATGASGKKDWLELSRKHEIDANRDTAHLSIFGGKLTDCLNVGEEVCGLIQTLGISLPHPQHACFGEPPEAVKKAFLQQAEAIGLDNYTSLETAEKLTCRLWRRYGSEAIRLLANIQADPKQAEVLIKGAEYLRCELQLAARNEMIVKLDDFLRRRSKIALMVRRQNLKRSAGLKEACKILFGKQAEEKLAEYFQEN
ncbi:glycerol-3-phosphate dehydrogenase/oxidase [Nitrosococcus oceani]|uniref:FAD dependent oxidoreductase n=2 Tax=Nitrosococcus oceani TaxID=1229 RepID=Q3J7P4_NITOC|nr:glycerol-3-phosphate dehydrogenase/oxidase [Nitrosococcus oceani]KFI18473.1 FAD-dependent oxidoreductase [Nitrosococcus oceani C-27]ABA59152.1 FAD dependent oxidoreductase [Nitrosococcus oceani ATCC 19707]EDZ65699.1 FAD dependent oxidoreductase domain protein [Nitrosococcus oceani AFC27]KFI21653.1 FAD-dependent oxidoreductase [Nitrosococcus oceani]GEM20320.1 FAD-dependent oxidoreductase [Nitrosococcus oceani]